MSHDDEEDPLDFEEWDPDSSSFVAHMVAGSIAGVAEHTIMFPVDTLKTHVQRLCSRAQDHGQIAGAAAALPGRGDHVHGVHSIACRLLLVVRVFEGEARRKPARAPPARCGNVRRRVDTGTRLDHDPDGHSQAEAAAGILPGYTALRNAHGTARGLLGVLCGAAHDAADELALRRNYGDE
mmetsp:Transcript_57492/g.158266  ORF Transcript_57492/g.158266 Transcript_57492/m.158266 type:complete len:181 (+) Transcript_57492:223-765(+)